jgi:hypothetical protein
MEELVSELEQRQQQIPPLRCGMTNKKSNENSNGDGDGNSNSRLPSGNENRKGKSKGNSRFLPHSVSLRVRNDREVCGMREKKDKGES